MGHSFLHGCLWGAIVVAGVAATSIDANAALVGHFDLPADTFVSAGVSSEGGSSGWRLLRSLWSRRLLVAGRHTITWDGLDDEGVPAAKEPGARLAFHVLAFNITYTWEGVIGNSVGQTGPTIPKGYNPPQAMAIAGDVVSCFSRRAETP